MQNESEVYRSTSVGRSIYRYLNIEVDGNLTDSLGIVLRSVFPDLPKYPDEIPG